MSNATPGPNPHPIPSSVVAGLLKGALGAAHSVTQPVFIDIENVPRSGPFMLVGNHQLLGLQDLPSLVLELERRRGVRVRGMGDHAHFAIPGWRDVLRAMGAVPGTRENCAALLAAGEAVLVFPGGAREVYKRRDQRYQLLWGERTGFARMAIAAGCPIVPFAAVGAEDRFEVAVDIDHPVAAPARALAERAGRADVGTVLVKGPGRGVLPNFGRLYFRFGEPIATTPWAGRAEDPEARAECRDLVKDAIEAGITELRLYREADDHRDFLPRVGSALRSALPF
jgi:1-acyl-sn-glycerol-3-phosphate acyltransferase